MRNIKDNNRVKHAAIALMLVAIGLVGFKVLKSSKGDLGRQKPHLPLPMVRVAPVQVGMVDMRLTGDGTVQALTESHVVPQVSGQVIEVSDNLVNGGAFKKGELLLVIDPRDYKIAVTLAAANVKDAESSYELARQESEAAQREWQRIHPKEPAPALVAKEPQLAAAMANLEARRASLEKTRLNLERTRIVAPFDGRLGAENVGVGQYVTPGQVLATIYAANAAEIVIPMDDADLQWFAVPGFTTDENSGANATVRANVAGRDMTWPGEVVRVEGKISEQTRMINVVVRVADPYATQPPLAIGQFVEVNIFGGTLAEATIIPRAALHDADTVWAVAPDATLDNGNGPDDGRSVGRLSFRTVDVARMDERGVVIRGGLKDGDRVVISPLKGATDGMRVRFVDTDLGADGGGAS
jgi:RND family efflux transporter MFP subunit